MTLDNRLTRAVREGDRVAVLTERMRRGDRSGLRCPRLSKPPIPDAFHGVGKESECPQCQGTGRAPLRSAVELAAYAGDEAARAVLGHGPHEWMPFVHAGDATTAPTFSMLDEWTPEWWLAGLARWPGALERSALYACESVLSWWEARLREMDDRTLAVEGERWLAARRALQAARAHLDAPSEATREACQAQVLNFVEGTLAERLCYFLGYSDRSAVQSGTFLGGLPGVVTEAARLAGEATVPAAAKRGLVAWACGDASLALARTSSTPSPLEDAATCRTDTDSAEPQ